MSFSSSVKDELAAVNNESECCDHAQAYGLALFGKTFSPRAISLTTEHTTVADIYCSKIHHATGVNPTVTLTKAGNNKIEIPSQEDRIKVYDAFSHSSNDISLRINYSNFNCDECYKAFLRGVFLSCGTVCDPNKSYHLEFVVSYAKLTTDLLKIIEDMNLSPKYSIRNSNHIIYFKNSEEIEELLALIGANELTLQFMVTKVEKDVINRINRKNNFEYANMIRTIDAGLNQVQAINKLKANGKFDSLTPELRELCEIRLQNPEASLSELSDLLDNKVTKSGIKHRLKKIVDLSKEL